LKRIGLFGGSFDPPHIAHVALAQEALTNLHLDEVRWIPAGQPWQKSRQLAAPTHREAMVRLAIEGEPRFVLDRCELQRRGASYTLDTVRELQAQLPDGESAEWVLLIGQDQYASLHTWRDWKELLSRVTVAVANRPGASVVVHPDVLRTPHRSVPLPMLNISSTQVREAVARGENINHLVPREVASYIARHGLYKNPM
jgi:nicotinate-nucleotide adenylyltransferase